MPDADVDHVAASRGRRDSSQRWIELRHLGTNGM